LASTLNQEHTITAVLGLTHAANAMATQEEQIMEEEDNDGAMNVQVNATKESTILRSYNNSYLTSWLM
jgi:hypothetical protein